MGHSEETKLKIKNRLKELFKLNPDKFITSKKESKIINCLECNGKMYLRPSDRKKFCSLECKHLARDKGYFKGKSGGMRTGSGRSRSGWYKGIYCNSSYELAWVIYSIDNNIKFNRNTKSFEYINTKGKISKYYPDFYLTNSKTYVEIKGYKEKEFENKQKYFTEKILVVDKNEIKPIINYVESKYGKNFIELYEGNPHKSKMNNCLICRKPAKNQYCSRVCSGIGVRKIKDSIDKN